MYTTIRYGWLQLYVHITHLATSLQIVILSLICLAKLLYNSANCLHCLEWALSKVFLLARSEICRPPSE